MSLPISTSANTTSRDLVDLGDVLSAIGLSDPTPAQTSELQRLITAASVRFTNLCGRSFRPENCTDIFRGPSYVGFLGLSHRPVISVTSVTDGALILSPSEYDIDLPRGMLYRMSGDYRTSWNASRVTVAYVAGFSQVPADVSEAVITVLAGKWLAAQSASGQASVLKSFTIEGVGREDYWTPSTSSSSSSSTLPADFAPVADVIQYYRGIVFA